MLSMNDVVRYGKICPSMGRQFKSEPSLQAGTTSSLIKDLSFYYNVKFQNPELKGVMNFASLFITCKQFVIFFRLADFCSINWRVFCSYRTFLLEIFSWNPFLLVMILKIPLQNFIKELIAEHAIFVPGEVRKQALRRRYELPSGLQLWLMWVKKHRRRSWFRCAF